MTLPASLAALPMYDWPEVRPAIDRMWHAIRQELIAEGIDAPAELTRVDDVHAVWADDALLLGQTCGLPLVQTVPDAVVVGSFDHRLPATPPGWYHSAVIVHADDDAEDLQALRGSTVAVNGGDSQSGHGVWRHELASRGVPDPFFGNVVVTGGHRLSLRAVADGRVRTAAIDGVSFALAQDHEPAAANVRVLFHTDPTPGLPLITAPRNRHLVAAMRRAITDAVETLGADDRATLHVHGFVTLDRADYRVVADRWNGAAAISPLTPPI